MLPALQRLEMLQRLELSRLLKTLQPPGTLQLLRTLQPPEVPALPPLAPLLHNMSMMPGQYRPMGRLPCSRMGTLMIRLTVRVVRVPMASLELAFMQGRLPMVTKPQRLAPWLPLRW